jgi:hypothetical protein
MTMFLASIFHMHLGPMKTQLCFHWASKMGLPTWIIGSPLNSSMDAPAYFLKVWPEREPVSLLTPDEFDPVICKIQESHCG